MFGKKFKLIWDTIELIGKTIDEMKGSYLVCSECGVLVSKDKIKNVRDNCRPNTKSYCSRCKPGWDEISYGGQFDVYGTWKYDGTIVYKKYAHSHTVEIVKIDGKKESK